MASAGRPTQLVLSTDAVPALPPQLLLTLQVAVFRVASASAGIAAALKDEVPPNDVLDLNADFIARYQQRHLAIRSLTYQGLFDLALEVKAFRDAPVVLSETASIATRLLTPEAVVRSRREARAQRQRHEDRQSASIAAAAGFATPPPRGDVPTKPSDARPLRELRQRRLEDALERVAVSHLSRAKSRDALGSAAILIERFRRDHRLSSSLHNLRTLRFTVGLQDEHGTLLATDR